MIKISATQYEDPNFSCIICQTSKNKNTFYPCDEQGNKLLEITESNWNDTYCCSSCNTIYHVIY